MVTFAAEAYVAKMCAPLLEAPSGKLVAVGEQVIFFAEGLQLHNEVPGDLTPLQASFYVVSSCEGICLAGIRALKCILTKYEREKAGSLCTVAWAQLPGECGFLLNFSEPAHQCHNPNAI